MKNLKEYTDAQKQVILDLHNSKVKEEYVSPNIFDFWVWVEGSISLDAEEPYIEIASNETLSGNACIIELDWEV